MQDIRYIARAILAKPYRYWLLPTWVFVLWLFTYLLSINLYYFIFTNPVLTLYEKIEFTISTITVPFTTLYDPRSLSLAVFSFMATVNILLMVRVLRERRKVHGMAKTGGASAAAVIGAHCVACGGSFLAPLITTIAGSGAYLSSARITTTGIVISTVINVLGILIITYATIKLARKSKGIPVNN